MGGKFSKELYLKGNVVFDGNMKGEHMFRHLKDVLSRKRLSITTTTGFMRNIVQFETLYELIPSPERIYVMGCSIGCEAYSLAMFYKLKDPTISFHIFGYDINKECVAIANEGTYNVEYLDYYKDGYFLKSTWMQYFDKDEEDNYRVRDEIRGLCDFGVGSVLDTAFMSSLSAADMILCQNVVIHLDYESNHTAIELLSKLMKPEAYLILGGMRPKYREKITMNTGLIPVSVSCENIHESQKDLRAFWKNYRFPFRPYYSLEPFKKCRNWEYRYSTIFRAKPK